MMTEIHGLRLLERDREYLVSSRKLSAVVAFSLIKSSDNNELTKEDIKNFLIRNSYRDVTQAEIDCIFWRLDHNKDGKLTYTDFCNVYDDSKF
jgi:Ca2+-binding EF-hand superfamily protein